MYVYFMLSIMNRLGLTRSYVTCTFASALVSKGQISKWHICLILKLALYKYHIIIIIKEVSTDSVNDLKPIMQYGFSQTNRDKDLWHHLVSLGDKELTQTEQIYNPPTI